jgi:hypothetical protein
MLPDVTLRIGDRDYAVCFTARARYLFGVAAGYSLTETKLFRGSQGDGIVLSDTELAWMLYAGLEGARLRQARPERRRPWTVDEVLDDVLGDRLVVDLMPTVLDLQRAVHAAFIDPTAAPPDGEDGESGKAPPPTGA